jgi:hypothetical protein
MVRNMILSHRIPTWVSFIFFLIFLSGCALSKDYRDAVQPYQSPSSGPTAKIHFVTNQLEGFFLADTNLDLNFYYPQKQCQELDSRGRIELEPDKNSANTMITANKDTYLRVLYSQNCFGCGTSSGKITLAFLPQEGKEYTVEYRMKGSRLKVVFYEGAPYQKKADVPTWEWSECKKRLNPAE